MLGFAAYGVPLILFIIFSFERISVFRDRVVFCINAHDRIAGAELYTIALAATVYYLWQERNYRIFLEPKEDKISYMRVIIQEVYFRASLFLKLNMYICS